MLHLKACEDYFSLENG